MEVQALYDQLLETEDRNLLALLTALDAKKREALRLYVLEEISAAQAVGNAHALLDNPWQHDAYPRNIAIVNTLQALDVPEPTSLDL